MGRSRQAGGEGTAGRLFRAPQRCRTSGFGVRKGEKIIAVDGLKRGATNRTPAIHIPINLPPCSNIAQIFELFGRRGGHGPLAMAKADHADANKQLPLREEYRLTAPRQESAVRLHPARATVWFERSGSPLQLPIQSHCFLDLQSAKNTAYWLL